MLVASGPTEAIALALVGYQKVVVLGSGKIEGANSEFGSIQMSQRARTDLCRPLYTRGDTSAWRKRGCGMNVDLLVRYSKIN